MLVAVLLRPYHQVNPMASIYLSFLWVLAADDLERAEESPVGAVHDDALAHLGLEVAAGRGVAVEAGVEVDCWHAPISILILPSPYLFFHYQVLIGQMWEREKGES